MASGKRNLSESRPIKTPVSPQARKSALRKSSVDGHGVKVSSVSPQLEASAKAELDSPPTPESPRPPCKLPRNDNGDAVVGAEILEVALGQALQSTSMAPPSPQQKPTLQKQLLSATSTASPSISPPSGTCPLLSLPPELLLNIAHYLPERSLAALIPTCRQLHNLTTHVLYRLGCHIEYLDQRTLLHLAAERGFYTTTHYLLLAGASPNVVSTPRNTHPYSSDGLTPLHIAARLNRVRIGRLLLAHGAKTRIWDSSGNTPLHTAVENGNTSMVRMLISAKAKLTPRRADGMRPLHVAVMMGQKRCARLLLEAGADVEARDDTGGTALGLAAGMDEEGCVKLLLSSGARCDVRDSQGWTPVFWAAWIGSVAILAELLRYGAVLEATDNEGNGVVVVARERGKMEAVRWLEKKIKRKVEKKTEAMNEST